MTKYEINELKINTHGIGLFLGLYNREQLIEMNRQLIMEHDENELYYGESTKRDKGY